TNFLPAGIVTAAPSGQGIPIFTQRTSVSTSRSLRGSFGGIGLGPSVRRTALMNKLSSGLPATAGGPVLPPLGKSAPGRDLEAAAPLLAAVARQAALGQQRAHFLLEELRGRGARRLGAGAGDEGQGEQQKYGAVDWHHWSSGGGRGSGNAVGTVSLPDCP